MFFLTGNIDASFEIRRILLLTHLSSTVRGRTLEQLVKECEKVVGWCGTGKTIREVVLVVVQSLIDDGLVALTRRFLLTSKGRDYLKDPSKWHIDGPISEDIGERTMFWTAIYSSIYETVDRVVRRIRSGNVPSPHS